MMIFVHLQDIRFDVKEKTLFSINDLCIYKGDRIGLVGRNGAGKTTLLELIAGSKLPTAGTITKHTSVALLPQIKPTLKGKSGGEITQTYINQTLLIHPGLLLADEPTTHLDMDHMFQLEQQLKRRNDTCVIVSHDRFFLDALCNQIWEIDDGKIFTYKGNYSDYEQQKAIARQHQEKEYEKVVRKRKQLEDAIRLREQKAQRATKKPKQTSNSEAKITGAKPYFAKKQKKLNQNIKSIRTRIEKLDQIEKIKELPPIQMQVTNEDSLHNRIIIRGEHVTGWINDRMLWDGFDFQIFGGDKVAIIGPNGSGKTTFLRKIIEGGEGVRISPAVNFGYFSQMLDVLDLNDSIINNVRNTATQDDTIIRTVLARLGFFRDDVLKPVNVLSGGERVKVVLAKLFVSHANVLILDEPTNFLDIESVEALEVLMKEYSGTVVFVTHDRRLLENVATRIFHIQNQRFHIFNGSYEEFVREKPQQEHDPIQDEMLKLEIKISDVLSRLSISPTEQLEQEFQQLITRKKELMKRLE